MEHLIKRIVISLIITIAIILLHPHSDLILGCGLFAFIGSDPKQYFNWDKFHTLGLFNDSRGGDACGRIFNDIVQYGLDKQKTYKVFNSSIKVNDPIETNVVLGHCRKASSGGKADIYAQPVVFYKRDLDLSRIKDTQLKGLIKKASDDTIIFSGIHNGTIENYLELAEQYRIPLENHNDSRVLLSCLFYGYYDILKEYIGTAALIWHNHVQNKTYVFKGESKSWTSSEVTSEERPLFVWKVTNDNYYVSSMDDSLFFIGGEEGEVLSIKSNTLYKFKDGINYTYIKIDRSKSTQNKSYTQNNYFGSNYKGGNNYKSRKDYQLALPEEKEYSELPWDYDRNNSKDTIGDYQGVRHIREFKISGAESTFRIANEKTDRYISRTLKKVIYNKTRYWMGEGLMHGIYPLNNLGIIPYASYSKEMVSLKLYYFVEGMMMDGLQAYIKAMRIHQDFMERMRNIGYEDFVFNESAFTFELAKYSRYAVAPLLNFIDTEECYSPINNGPDPIKNLYTGEYVPLFGMRKYRFRLGELISIVEDFKFENQAKHTIDDVVNTDVYLKNSEHNDNSIYSVGKNLLMKESYKNPMSPIQKVIFSNANLSQIYPKEYEIFVIQSLRNFTNIVKDSCHSCVDEESQFIRRCLVCDHIRTGIVTLENKELYEFYEG